MPTKKRRPADAKKQTGDSPRTEIAQRREVLERMVAGLKAPQTRDDYAFVAYKRDGDMSALLEEVHSALGSQPLADPVTMPRWVAEACLLEGAEAFKSKSKGNGRHARLAKQKLEHLQDYERYDAVQEAYSRLGEKGTLLEDARRVDVFAEVAKLLHESEDTVRKAYYRTLRRIRLGGGQYLTPSIAILRLLGLDRRG